MMDKYKKSLTEKQKTGEVFSCKPRSGNRQLTFWAHVLKISISDLEKSLSYDLAKRDSLFEVDIDSIDLSEVTSMHILENRIGARVCLLEIVSNFYLAGLQAKVDISDYYEKRIKSLEFELAWEKRESRESLQLVDHYIKKKHKESILA